MSILRLFAIVAVVALTQRPGPQPTTLIFVCGEDQKLAEPIPLTWATVALAADSRGFMPCSGDGQTHTTEHREFREGAVISQAARARDPELRRAAAHAYGLLGSTASIGFWSSTPPPAPGRGAPTAGSGILSTKLTPATPFFRPGTLLRLLAAVEPQVRREAASALGDVLSVARSYLNPEPPASTDYVTQGQVELLARLKVELDDEVAGTILETIGRLPYDDATADLMEAELVAAAAGAPARLLGATKGLEALIRSKPRRPIGEATRVRLRELAASGPPAGAVPTTAGEGSLAAPGPEDLLARTRRLAMHALRTAADNDIATVLAAARDGDWQVRQLAVQRMNPALPDFKQALEQAARDSAFQVRLDVLKVVGPHIASTKECAPLLAALDDAEVTVVLQALDLLPPSCQDGEEVVKRVAALADAMRLASSRDRWHVPAHALAALARIAPGSAKELLPYALAHDTWQVRALAASMAVSLGDDAMASNLAADREPNVRNAALEALLHLKSDKLASAALEALKSDDYQLIRAAASLLKGAPDALHYDAASGLLLTLRRLTDAAADTSRDPRVAILDRLEEMLGRDRAGELMAWIDDFDRGVREVAVRVLSALGGAPSMQSQHPKFRYPLQPTPEELAIAPKSAIIKMVGGGVIELELLPAVAPVTVARFVQLVKAGYYNGLTFHRVVPNFVIQGGSPGANEYMGTSRYMRDEVGLAPHLRGAVGISTRGHDTGDGQFFIDLVDLPRLDHTYTVFARVTAGMDVVERILEGAKIQAIQLGR